MKPTATRAVARAYGDIVSDAIGVLAMTAYAREPAMKKLPKSVGFDADQALIARHILSLKERGCNLRILEAGCGSKWWVDIGKEGYEITGVDSDAEALRLRLEVSKDLHKGIVGDLRTVVLDNDSFDVIFSSYVLEHIEGAKNVLEKSVSWLRKGGLLIIKIPDPYSTYGFTARFTPHWIHIFYYIYVVGISNAGKLGSPPYRAYYDPVVSRRGMHEFCKENNMTILEEYGIVQGKHTSLIWKLIEAWQKFLSLISFGSLSSDHNDLLYIIRK